MNSSHSDNPKDRPWLRPGQPKQPRPSAEALPGESAPFSALYVVLTLLMWFNTVVGVILVIAGVAGNETVIAGLMVLGGAIACALGRVLVHGANSLHILVQLEMEEGPRL